MKVKRKMPDDITKCCDLCEYAKKVEISGDILCSRSKNLKKVSELDVCRHFSFDILAYRPHPTQLPKFTVESVDDIL